MDKAVQQMVSQSGAAFVKMSDRSPKDSATELGRIQRCLGPPIEETIKETNNRGLSRKKMKESNQYGLPAVYR